MRHFWLLLVLALFAASYAADVPARPEAAPEEPAPDQPRDEPLFEEMPGNLTLTLDPGGHTGEVRKVLFTPDGKHLITVSFDHSIRIWDVATGQTRRVLRPPGVGFLRPAALAPDGETLAVATRYPDGDKVIPIIYLINLADGRILRALKGHTALVSAIAFSADGKRVASSADDNTARIWNVATGQTEKVLKGKKPGPKGVLEPRALAFAPDGSKLVFAPEGIVDLRTGNRTQLFTEKMGLISTVAWSPDGKTVATGSGSSSWSFGVLLWEPDGKLRKPLLQKEIKVQSISFSADGHYLLATGNEKGTLHHCGAVYDMVTGREKTRFLVKKGPNSTVYDGALSPDGELAATTGGYSNIHETFLWKTADGTLVKRLAADPWFLRRGAGRSFRWSDDSWAVGWGAVGQVLGKFHFGDLRLGPGRPKEVPHGPVLQEGPLSLEKEKGNLAVRVMKDGNFLALLKLPPGSHGVESLTLVDQDRAALSDDWGRGLFLYDIHTGKVIRRIQGAGSSLAPSPDRRFLLSFWDDQILRIWNPEQEKPLLNLFINRNDWIVWTPEGYYAATPGGERLMGWTVDHGPDRMASFYPAERFRKQLYRPDVIKLLLEKGSVAEALKAADALRGQPSAPADLEKLLPPRASLKLLDQQGGVVKLRVTAEAGVREQPVTALRLLVDGRPLPDRAGCVEFPKGQEKAEAEWSVTLPPGKHFLAVLARSPDASSVSPPLEAAFSAPKEQPVLHVLAVGIDAYQDPYLKLQFAAADARAIADAFRQSSTGGLFRDVSGDVLVNDQAHREAVLKGLAALRRKVEPNDLVVVFFAGHGVKDKDQFYLLTVEAKTDDLAHTSVSGAELRKALGEFPCQVLLLLDACHSGASLKSFRPATDDLTRTLTDDECGVAVLCAAMGHEKALEKADLKHGLFTQAVVQALSQAEGVPFNRRDRRLYVHHLHAFVFDEVKEQSGDRQHPFLSLPWVVESFAIRQLSLPGSKIRAQTP